MFSYHDESSKYKMNKKGVSPLVGGVLFTAMIIATTSIILSGVIPSLDEMHETVVIDSMQESMNYLNQYIELVAHEGERSQRVIPFSVKEGAVYIASGNASQANRSGSIYFEYETTSQAISPRTSRSIGDLVFSSNTEMNASKNDTYIKMENEHLEVLINRTGEKDNPVTIDTEQLLDNIYQKDLDKHLFMDDDKLSLLIKGLPKEAEGYVDIIGEGEDLAKSEAVAYLNHSSIEYEIHFILESGTDYLKVRVISPRYFDWVEANVTSTDHVKASSSIDISNRYVVSSTQGEVLALVSRNEADTDYDTSSNYLSLKQPFKINNLYIAFTKGDENIVHERLRYIKDGSFERLYSPSFGYPIEDKNSIRMTIAHDDINIYGNESLEGGTKKLYPGNHRLLVRNMGIDGKETNILVKLI